MGNHSNKDKEENTRDKMSKSVGTMESRKIRSQADKYKSVWFGVGMFGIIGWSVALPTLLGIAIGVWMDSLWPGRFSWTLTLLFLGMIFGCLNAWYWVKRQSGRQS